MGWGEWVDWTYLAQDNPAAGTFFNTAINLRGSYNAGN